jgi:hypothetical protein
LKEALDQIKAFLKSPDHFVASKILLKAAVKFLHENGHRSGMTPITSTPLSEINPRLSNSLNINVNSG